MPAYRVNVGECLIWADNEEEARIACCTYIGGDLGIECLEAIEDPTESREDCDYKV